LFTFFSKLTISADYEQQ